MRHEVCGPFKRSRQEGIICPLARGLKREYSKKLRKNDIKTINVYSLLSTAGNNAGRPALKEKAKLRRDLTWDRLG